MTKSKSTKKSGQAASNVNSFLEARTEIDGLLQECQEIVNRHQDKVAQLIEMEDNELEFKERIIQDQLTSAQEHLRWLTDFKEIYEERLKAARDVNDYDVNPNLNKLLEFANSREKEALRHDIKNIVTTLRRMQEEVFQERNGIPARPQDMVEPGHPTIGEEEQLPNDAPMVQGNEDLDMTRARQDEDLSKSNIQEQQRATVMELSSQQANNTTNCNNGEFISGSPMESRILNSSPEELERQARNQANSRPSAREFSQPGNLQGKPVNTSTPRVYGEFNGFDTRIAEERDRREIHDSRLGQGEQARTFVKFPASQIPSRISQPRQATLARPNFNITTSPESHQVPFENYENQNYHQNLNQNFNQVQRFQEFQHPNLQQNFNQNSNYQNFNEFQNYPQNFNQFQSCGENWNGPARNANLGYNNSQNYVGGQSFQGQDPRMYRPNYNQNIARLDTRYQSRGVELQNTNGNFSNLDYQNIQNSNPFYNLNPNSRSFGNPNPANSYPQPNFNISRIHEGSKGKSNEIRFKLQKLLLPEFEGDEMKFTAFLQSFDVFIGQDPARTDLEKLMFLKQACKGKAAQVLDNYPAAPGFYNLARTALMNRFAMGRDGPQRIWMKLERIPNSDLKPDQLSSTIDQVKNAIFQLQYLGENIDGISIETTILRKFPEIIRHRLKDIATSNSVHLVPTGSTTLDMLDQLDYVVNEHQRDREFEKDRLLSVNYSPRHIDANVARCEVRNVEEDEIEHEYTNSSDIEELITNVSNFKFARTRGNDNNKYHSQHQPKEDIYGSKVPCLYCKSTDHQVYNCKLSHKERIEKIAQENRCMNCLRLGHPTNNCKSRYCRGCNQKHHESICEAAMDLHEYFEKKLKARQEQAKASTGEFFRGQH